MFGLRLRGQPRARGIAVAVLLLLLTTACEQAGTAGPAPRPTQTGPTELTPVSFRLDWIITGEHTHFFVALEQGFFADEGLNVEILEGGGSGLALQQVGNKDDDFGLADFGALASARSEGLNVKTVANIFRRSPHVIVSLESAGISAPEDLRGRKIGAAPGESPLTLLPAYLAANGMSESDVEVVSMDAAAKLPALYEGRVDALVGFAPSEVPIMAQSAPEPVAVQYYADHGVISISSGIIAHDDTIAERPEVVAAFVRAVQRGIEWARDHPDEAVDAMAARFPRSVNRDEARAALDVVVNLLGDQSVPIGRTNEDAVDQTLATLQEYGGLRNVSSRDTYFTNEFVESEP
jgi:NitT/TauT family transport system substrate-binding protein